MVTAGCIGGGEVGGGTPTETPGVMNPTYLGVHEDHVGPEITSVEYQVHNACKAAFYVEFAEPPDYENGILAAWFYRDGENFERATIGLEEPDGDDPHQLLFPFCEIKKYDAYKIGVLSA